MNTACAEDENNGMALTWMKNKAVTINNFIAGSIAVKANNHFYNRFICVGPHGEIFRYDKKHLFSYGKENNHYSPGNAPLTFSIGDWSIRAMVCYDLRFPVWSRNNDDYDVLLVVANWPQARIHHWDALLRARAIENQCYVVAVNRVGTDGNNLVYNGHSVVYDMNGQLLLNLEDAAGIGSVTLDKDILTAFRQQYRFLQDRDAFSL
jgi:predicted amidohydrolase